MKKNNNTVLNPTTQKKPNIFKVFINIIPIIVKETPILFFTTQALSILHGVSFGVKVMFSQKFFDKATEFATGQDIFVSVIISLLMFVLVSIISEILNSVSNYIPNIMIQKCTGKLSYKIHRKIARLTPIFFEDTEILDDINKAEQGKNNALWFAFIFTLLFSFYIPYFLFMGWYLFTLKPILVWAIAIVFVPTMLTQILRAKVFSKLEDKSAPVRREYDYYADCMAGREYYKETVS